MELELIKSELARRVHKLVTAQKNPETYPLSTTTVKTWKDKVADTEDLVKKVYETLFEVLQSNGIQLSNNRELDGLISVLEPSVNDLIIKNIED